MKNKGNCVVYRKKISSPVGTICLEADQEALLSLYIIGSEAASRWTDREEKGEGFRVLEQAEQELLEYFEGERKEFTVPIRFEGTEFQRKVWNALREIPYGETRSYAEVAQMVGSPRACRAVGGANNRNPIMILTPCHRVVGADGSLVGFGGGLEAKKYLLDLEKKVVSEEESPERADLF